MLGVSIYPSIGNDLSTQGNHVPDLHILLILTVAATARVSYISQLLAMLDLTRTCLLLPSDFSISLSIETSILSCYQLQIH